MKLGKDFIERCRNLVRADLRWKIELKYLRHDLVKLVL